MTTAAENDILTRVGPGTPMGGLMRQYWIPAAMSSELASDGDPMRLTLLGEQLVAFRDTNGKVGVMDHRCPHRCASLFFGRNEEGGIRCVYHGWKFDADGNCLDMANVPPHQDFKHKVKAKAYRTAERNGLIWVFMGDQANVPALPPIEPTLVPEAQMFLHLHYRECNWLQALEGEMDTSHVGFLHHGLAERDKFADHIKLYTVVNRAPEFAAAETDYGFSYGAFRATDDDKLYWRVAQFLFPFWVMPPLDKLELNIQARAYVPVDDENTMIFILFKKDIRDAEQRRHRDEQGGGPDFQYVANTTDWRGRWRVKGNRANDYMLDREKQRTGTYTGVQGITLQDQMITESMGPIVDRTFEHLAPSDMPIARTRRLLLRAASDHAETGALPPGACDPEVFRDVRGGAFYADKDADWQAICRETVLRSSLDVRIAAAAE